MEISSQLPLGSAPTVGTPRAASQPAAPAALPGDSVEIGAATVAAPAPPTSASPAPATPGLVRSAAHGSLDGATGIAFSLAGQPAAAAAIRPPSSEMTERLKALLPPNPFHITGKEADRLASELGLSKQQLMVELIPVARAYARPPISHYNVGAVGLGKSGDLYLGVNLEFGRQALNQTVHGEQFVTANAMAYGEKGLEAIAVSAEPCGHCRQFLNELDGGSELTVLIPEKQPVQIKELLPRSFGPGDLGITAGLLAQNTAPLSLPADAPALAKAAVEAANNSYAPYSNNPAGVAVRTADGAVFRGCYAENAAFNPSLSPLQAALIQMVAAGRDYREIAEAALVEAENAQVSQIGNTRFLLECVAPSAKLSVHLAPGG